MKRVAYFGTQGGGIAGHEFTAIVGAFSFEEEREVNRLDSDKTFEVFEGKRQFKFFNYSRYMCLAFPASPDDKRGGSITIALVEGASEQKEVLDAIEASGFMKRQFERLVKMYGIPLPSSKRLMNRIIKFRGKSVHTNEWHYGSLMQPSDNAYLIHEKGTAGFFSISDTIGQFTGLTDKNGKEVYEGDIMQIGTEKAVVIYSANGFYQKVLNDGPTYCNFNMYEVIGNIHDNPELVNS